MARINFGGATIDVRGYVNHIGEKRQAGQAEVLDVLIGWTTAPKKGQTQGERQTVKASIWNYSSQRDDIGMFLKFVKKGQQISVKGAVELDTYEKSGVKESIMRMTIDEYTPAGRDEASNVTSNGNRGSYATAGTSASNSKAAFSAQSLDEEIPF